MPKMFKFEIIVSNKLGKLFYNPIYRLWGSCKAERFMLCCPHGRMWDS